MGDKGPLLWLSLILPGLSRPPPPPKKKNGFHHVVKNTKKHIPVIKREY